MRLSEFDGDFLTIRVKIKVEKDDGCCTSIFPVSMLKPTQSPMPFAEHGAALTTSSR